MKTEEIELLSAGHKLRGTFFPALREQNPGPAVVVCHGAMDYRENCFNVCESLAAAGLSALAIDMHGHGKSEGERFCVRMDEWVPDVVAAVDWLAAREDVAVGAIGAFGHSSGGTAILEAALVDERLGCLVALDATVRDAIHGAEALLFRALLPIAEWKRKMTGNEMRISLAIPAKWTPMAVDPDINRQILDDPRHEEAYRNFPLPGAAECFFVDTITRVGAITAPTLVLHGEEDAPDPPETARLLFDALNCEKKLDIVAGTGHCGHLDRNREHVLNATVEWMQKHLGSGRIPAAG